MPNRSTGIIAAGVIVALLGAFTVIAYARSVQRSSTAGPVVTAFAASSDIAAGTKGADARSRIRKTSVPKGILPRTAIADPGALTGRIAVRPITAGEVITSAQFGSGSNAAPASGLQIPPGKNALTMNLPVPQAAARFVQPGDLVNVYATFKDAKPQPTTRLLLSNVQVLANASAGQPSDPARLGQSGDVLLTLALSPEDAERAIFAAQTGSVWIGLVRPGDGPATTSGQTSATVLR